VALISRRSADLGLVILLTALTLCLVPSTAQAQEDRRGDDAFVVLTGRAEVTEGQTVDTVVIFNGPAIVDGTVREEVVAFNGSVTVSGHVGADVVAFNGRVTIQSGAEVSGDIVSRRGVVVEDGATVEGDIREDATRLFDGPFHFLRGRLFWWLAVSISILLLGIFLLLLGPRFLDSVHRSWRAAIGRSIGLGIALFLGLPLLALLSLVTLVGIPFGFGLLMALFAIYTMGYTTSVWILGRQIVKPPSSRFVAFLAGWAIFRLVALVPILAGIVWFVAAVFGLGVLLVVAWRSRASATIPAALDT
jgi:hypothetical protein